MSARVFDTYHAEDAEILGVKQALDAVGIDWYETEKGRWWVGSAAIWIKREDKFAEARAAIDAFQLEWQENIKNGFDADPVSMAPAGIRWNRVPILIITVGLVLFLLSFGFRL